MNEHDPYYAEISPPLRAWRIMHGGQVVDIVRTASAAAYEVDLLNAGRAQVDHHGTLGCRVVLAATVAA